MNTNTNQNGWVVCNEVGQVVSFYQDEDSALAEMASDLTYREGNVIRQVVNGQQVAPQFS